MNTSSRDEQVQQLENQLQSFTAMQEHHQTERESLGAAQQTENTTLAEKHIAQSKSLQSRQGREQQEFWQCFSDKQKQVHTELSRERQSLLAVSGPLTVHEQVGCLSQS